jgi:acyl-CoA oxidase
MSAILHGSEKALALKEKFMHEVSYPTYQTRVSADSQIARHPAFKLSDIHDMTKDELRERTMEKVSHHTLAL